MSTSLHFFPFYTPAGLDIDELDHWTHEWGLSRPVNTSGSYYENEYQMKVNTQAKDQLASAFVTRQPRSL